MKIFIRLALLAAAIATGVWLWTILFPSPEKIIRQKLAEAARDVSFNANESPLAAVGKAQKVAALFSTNVEVNLDVPEYHGHAFAGRDEIMQAVAGARASLTSLNVEFPDVNVTIAPDKQSAVADLTLKAQSGGNKDFIWQEMKFTFQKTGGGWLITRVETVRTLT
ncbi:MAG TPA: nuclear transport factor 2 family protein [Methylomirabilota bacterium]|nr:nuclear transport factor 2 family protein [Methylomirabilota bacterium]